MKKSYLLDEIDCPHCAAKLEDAIATKVDAATVKTMIDEATVGVIEVVEF